MNCTEFDAIAPDLERAGVLDAAACREALAHAESCPRCASRREAEQRLSAALQSVSLQEAILCAPPRVEARLRAALVAAHARRIWLTTRWLWGASVTAVLLLSAGGYLTLRWVAPASHGRPDEQTVSRAEHVSKPETVPGTVVEAPAAAVSQDTAPSDNDLLAVGASLSGEGFLPLQEALPLGPEEEASLVRVRLPRSELAAFGLPINEERAGDLIEVDFLLGQDGSPRAVRQAE